MWDREKLEAARQILKLEELLEKGAMHSISQICTKSTRPVNLKTWKWCKTTTAFLLKKMWVTTNFRRLKCIKCSCLNEVINWSGLCGWRRARCPKVRWWTTRKLTHPNLTSNFTSFTIETTLKQTSKSDFTTKPPTNGSTETFLRRKESSKC